MIKGLYILGEHAFGLIYGEEEQRDISEAVEIVAPLQTAESIQSAPELLKDVEAIFSGWGGPQMDAAFLTAAPHLKVVFYGAGSIKGIVSDAFWDRGILISSAYGANAVPVAEFALSQILFCLKRGWYYALTTKREGKHAPRVAVAGGYGSTVGIVSLGMIGRLVADLLKRFDVRVLAYDPFVNEKTAAEYEVELCSLDDLFARSDVVSCHTPWLKETENLIRGKHFESMPEGASFINTARGAVVHEPEMIEVLKKRPDLTAVLDVTHPEPPLEGSPIYTLPNVVLTPHIAGSMNRECRRMGRYMVQELERYLGGKELKYGISREKSATMA